MVVVRSGVECGHCGGLGLRKGGKMGSLGFGWLGCWDGTFVLRLERMAAQAQREWDNLTEWDLAQIRIGNKEAPDKPEDLYDVRQSVAVERT